MIEPFYSGYGCMEPQAFVANKHIQFRRPRRCKMKIGLFWKRLGEPAGA